MRRQTMFGDQLVTPRRSNVEREGRIWLFFFFTERCRDWRRFARGNLERRSALCVGFRQNSAGCSIDHRDRRRRASFVSLTCCSFEPIDSRSGRDGLVPQHRPFSSLSIVRSAGEKEMKFLIFFSSFEMKLLKINQSQEGGMTSGLETREKLRSKFSSC